MARALLVRTDGRPAVCPPKHRLTDAWVLANRATLGTEAFELYLVNIAPGGEGEDDVHPDCDHGFFVLDGEAEAYVGGDRFELRRDDFLFIPRGANHSVRPRGNRPLRMLVLMAPHRGTAH